MQALQAFSRESVKSAFCPICPFRTLLVWPWTSPCEMLSADDLSSWRAKIAPKNCFSEACGAYSIELQSRNSAATGSVKKNWASPCSDVKSGCDFLSRFCDQQKFRNVLILIQVAYISYITLNVYHIFVHICSSFFISPVFQSVFVAQLVLAVRLRWRPTLPGPMTWKQGPWKIGCAPPHRLLCSPCHWCGRRLLAKSEKIYENLLAVLP